ncbi:cytochrome P450 71D9-like [Tripterygium wilfordii]|uniref:cytochrome P450 71D9-like n=1 Tax=Tripterygium wilfordii TaxID=458696 RepID=UPI0018F7FCC6|nr:cytochrome P450 71D9-like [Tripterygium wilfordii]
MDHQFPSFPVLLSFLVFIFMPLRIWSKSEDKKSNSVAPPGSWKLPLIGNLHQMIGCLPHRRLRDLATKYGPIMHLQVGEVSTVIFSSPEVAKEVMKTNDIKFATRPYSLAVDIIYYNIKNIGFAPYGEYWRQIRKLCIVEVFSGRRVQAARPIREEVVLEFIKSISLKARSKINLSEMLTWLTFAITVKAAFGGVSERHQSFVPLTRKIMEVANLFPSMKFFHTINGMRTRLERVLREIDQIFESLINEHKFNRSRIDSSDADNFLDILLNLQEHGDFSFTTYNIKAVVLIQQTTIVFSESC